MPQDEAAKGLRPRVTLLDVADRAADPRYTGSLMPTSPRSVEACLRQGIDPATLAQRPLEYYVRRERDEDLGRLAFEYEERLRQVRGAARGAAELARAVVGPGVEEIDAAVRERPRGQSLGAAGVKSPVRAAHQPAPTAVLV